MVAEESEVLVDVEGMTREEGMLYYVSFKSGHLQVFKAKMCRGGRSKFYKKEEEEK